MSQKKQGFAAKVAEALKETVKENIQPGKILGDMGKELGRLAEQGKAELAGAMFNANAFVPYGAGQEPVKTDKDQEKEKAKEAEKEQDRGMEM
jgi:hypothetical protein